MSDTIDLGAALAARRLTLLGCGKMGGALLQGWLAAGAPADALTVIEPSPSPALRELLATSGVALRAAPQDDAPAAGVLVAAVKPQMMADALAAAAGLIDSKTLLMSIAAGLPIAYFSAAAPGAPVVRAMPNTPAAVGAGITALVANPAAGARDRALAEALASVVGEAVWLEDEAQMDSVTALSGSGPAYVFHLIEAMAAAGVAEGLPAALSMRLARATVQGAGALAAASPEPAETLRRNVTSPGGTTAAGLEPLMAEPGGLTELMTRTVAAAAARSRALGRS